MCSLPVHPVKEFWLVKEMNKELETLVFESVSVIYLFCFHDVGIWPAQISGVQEKKEILSVTIFEGEM